jgi:hypothetical protein
MGQQIVVSREYKVMLRPARFDGDEKRLLKTADALWRDFRRSAADVVIDTGGRLAEVKARRLITFFDTSDQDLNQAGYIFRQRDDVDGGNREITLKFRHADRYVAQSRDMKSARRPKARTKFEEDIKGPFISLYSFSTTLGVDDGTALTTLGEIARLFPDIRERLHEFRPNRTLAAVNHFTAREVVIAGGRLQIGRTPKIVAECALVVWYNDKGRHDKPVAVELSFRYGDKAGNYGGGMSRRAFDVFHALPKKLTGWVDPKPRTKTAFVYG